MACLPPHGVEWLVDAVGCDPARLADPACLERLFEGVVREAGLHPIGRPQWHRFPAPGGVTGFWLLEESHLSCHTFPEFGSACLDLFCCVPRPAWPWEERLAAALGAARVTVRRFAREVAPVPAAAGERRE